MTLNQFAIVESTLREGEQFVGANFSSDDKLEIARALDEFGVEYLELTSAAASPKSKRDCQRIAGLGLNTKVLTHIRCHQEDAKIALDAGVDGINLVIGTSYFLREYSHGKDIDTIIELASEVLTFIREQAPEVELRFSTEDSFRSTYEDLSRVYLALDKLGVVDRFGIADTVGVSTPNRVYDLVRMVRAQTDAYIEFHGHNDTGCAIANCYAALDAGATHIDTTVLGIGERNGIAPLAGFIARMYAEDKELIKQKYNLPALAPVHEIVSQKVGLPIPVNHYIVGDCAFNHKAGIHTKAMLNNANAYEIIDPTDFGLNRNIQITHKLTGWHAIANRVSQLGLDLSISKIKTLTKQIKEMADQKDLTLNEVDDLLWAAAQAPNSVPSNRK
ncbi:homocitrate synthase [Thalassoporum mexicanum PCC 7367]|uniref:homocitrate synthase n=1 Tax=Thalassoporum mexicanum TaxID=3457544 RepID=UPI00029FCB44|nr:homocitrate synthase [Pseudanabaena sp. PCC 7367]AFY70487.1 homocitrate synthase [Pseudanabaena sp. PCC 7367]